MGSKSLPSSPPVPQIPIPHQPPSPNSPPQRQASTTHRGEGQGAFWRKAHSDPIAIPPAVGGQFSLEDGAFVPQGKNPEKNT